MPFSRCHVIFLNETIMMLSMDMLDFGVHLFIPLCLPSKSGIVSLYSGHSLSPPPLTPVAVVENHLKGYQLLWKVLTHTSAEHETRT